MSGFFVDYFAIMFTMNTRSNVSLKGKLLSILEAACNFYMDRLASVSYCVKNIKVVNVIYDAFKDIQAGSARGHLQVNTHLL